MTLWTAVLLASIICVALKAVGYLLPARWLDAPRPARIADLLTVALLAALVMVQTLGAGPAIVVDARLPAVAVAALLLVDIGLGILSRFASQLNPFSLALTIKSLTAVLVLLLYVSSSTFSAMNELHDAWPLERLLPTPALVGILGGASAAFAALALLRRRIRAAR